VLINDPRFGGDHPPFPQMAPTMRDKLHALTCLLAQKAGRIAPRVSQADYERAKREVTGEADLERQNAILDSVDYPHRVAPAVVPAYSS
jgi:hypothetical protein